MDAPASRQGRRHQPPDRDSEVDAAFERLLARSGLPDIEEYRRVYESFGIPWPGDDEVRRLHPVAPPPRT